MMANGTPSSKKQKSANPPQALPYEGRGNKSIALEGLACLTGNAMLAPCLAE